MNDVSLISNNASPLCFMPNGALIVYNCGRIQILRNYIVEKEIPIPISAKERLLGWSKMATRLMRFGVRNAHPVDNENVILSIGNTLYELDLVKGRLSDGWKCREGIRPLILSAVNRIDGFEDGVYFGEYYKNDSLEPVNIYRRTGIDQWEIVYTFPKGAIKHVHNIIADPYRNCVWVLTGDFDDAAAIWKVTEGFQKVERFAYGDQRWRGCVAYATPEGLLYATDTPFSENHFFLLKEDGSVKTVGDLCGSCIYGCKWNDKYVFSSTVEADGRDETLTKLMFSKKRGSGIKDGYVRLYIGDYANGFEEAYKEKKDWLPFIFQFGAFKFPTGENHGDKLVFQPVATKVHDQSVIALKMIAD